MSCSSRLAGAACRLCGLDPRDALFQLFLSTSFRHFHDCRNRQLDCAARFSHHCGYCRTTLGRAKRRAEEAETGKREIERLYAELRDAFERASHAEALRQSEKLKSALLDAVTHDLRTPLTSIKASITTLLDEVRGRLNGEPIKLDAESRVEMMEVIDEESDRLSRFINGLIELARIEAGELQLRRRWGAVDEIISAALSRAEPITRQHRVELEVEKELPGVRVDERAVSEVVYTLIDNAAKYSPKGSTIRITRDARAMNRIEMGVEDEGPGIPSDLRERVFDKFFRATRDGDIRSQQPPAPEWASRSRKESSKRTKERSGSSRPDGRGTRVLFTFPIGDEDVIDEPRYSAATVEAQ